MSEFKHAINAVSCALCAGAAGGMFNFVMVALSGALHITDACGVHMGSRASKEDLYSKVFWGGLWGLLFLEPFLKRVVPSAWLRSCVYGLIPSLVQIFLVFPLATPYGIGGVGLGGAMPVFVLIFNIAGWSLPACAWMLITGTLNSYSDDDEGTFYTNPLLS